MLLGHDPGRKGSVTPLKAKVMIPVIRGMLADLRVQAVVPRRDAPQWIGGRMSPVAIKGKNVTLITIRVGAIDDICPFLW